MEFVIIGIAFFIIAAIEWFDPNPKTWVWKTRRFLARFKK